MSENIHIVAASAQHTHTVIFLHGRGSNAREFASEFFESQASDGQFITEIFPGFKWVYPCATIRHAETEDEDMHQWFDMAFIWEIMRKEAEEVGGMNKVILAGISQGCATAIIALLAGGARVAAFIGFSSWLPFEQEILHIATEAFTIKADPVKGIRNLLFPNEHPGPGFPDCGSNVSQVPVLVEHAEDDDTVPFQNGAMLRDGLRALGMRIDWQQYTDGGHWVNEPQGIDDMARFVTKCLARSSKRGLSTVVDSRDEIQPAS
ncbi:alpha/beta-hydrolase [Polyplosphaeria fusca]|uniref:Alpha/beta-hydrolase n=1 Tax=Polyplosphaeria fusca TaxID=682080 RepID=A0A9P4QXZ5_9PLEO|nr:alpha/beta-hydrolase [Polyplosphaeria fusca]